MRRLLLLLLLTALVGCGTAEPPRVEAVEVEPVWSDVATREEYPDRIVVRVTLENPSAAIKLLRGRMRIGYAGKWVAMLTLEQKVKIPARTNATVELPLRLNIQRTTQTMQLRSALRQRRTEGVEVDWQMALRTRGMYVEQSEDKMSLERLAGRNIDQIRDMLAEIFDEQSPNREE